MSKPTPLAARSAYAADNLEAAKIIMRSPGRYQGIQIEWAIRIIDPEATERASRLLCVTNGQSTEGEKGK